MGGLVRANGGKAKEQTGRGAGGNHYGVDFRLGDDAACGAARGGDVGRETSADSGSAAEVSGAADEKSFRYARSGEGVVGICAQEEVKARLKRVRAGSFKSEKQIPNRANCARFGMTTCG